jgi:predicted Zn-dependent peptidase
VLLVPQEVYQHVFSNGLTLLAERMEHVRSAAFSFLVPAGCGYDPPEQPGLAGVVAELITRGAGKLDKEELADALDRLGVDRGESVGVVNMRFRASTLAKNLPAALDIYADIIRRPHLPEDELPAVIDLAVQDVNALEDEHSTRAMLALYKQIYPAPLSNDHRGTLQGLEAVTPDAVRKHFGTRFGPHGTILSVAGNVEWESLREQVGRLFGDWQGGPPEPFVLGGTTPPFAHLEKQLEQTQIAVAYPSVSVGDSDYYQAMGAVEVLSGGMGARLFTEIREKEGLCYSVNASFQPLKDRGAVVAFAASLNHQAQRTLDKLIEELLRLPKGIEAEEVERVRVGLKTSLIMEQESVSARAGGLASDWYYLGRVRPFEEVQTAIEGLTPESILAHLHRHPPRDFRVVTLGPTALSLRTKTERDVTASQP